MTDRRQQTTHAMENYVAVVSVIACAAKSDSAWKSLGISYKYQSAQGSDEVWRTDWYDDCSKYTPQTTMSYLLLLLLVAVTRDISWLWGWAVICRVQTNFSPSLDRLSRQNPFLQLIPLPQQNLSFFIKPDSMLNYCKQIVLYFVRFSADKT